MSENNANPSASGKAGLIGWKIGQEPNILAAVVGICCCCCVSFWNLHLYLTELESNLGISSSMHWLKVILSPYGLIELDIELSKLEQKYGIEYQRSLMSPGFLSALVIPVFLWPFTVNSLLQRANAIYAAKQASEQA